MKRCILALLLASCIVGPVRAQEKLLPVGYLPLVFVSRPTPCICLPINPVEY